MSGKFEPDSGQPATPDEKGQRQHGEPGAGEEADEPVVAAHQEGPSAARVHVGARAGDLDDEHPAGVKPDAGGDGAPVHPHHAQEHAGCDQGEQGVEDPGVGELVQRVTQERQPGGEALRSFQQLFIDTDLDMPEDELRTRMTEVLDASTDDTGAIAAEFPVKVLKLAEGPSGPGHGRNRGAEIATGEILFFVDADVVIQKEAVGRVAEVFVDNPDVAAVFDRWGQADMRAIRRISSRQIGGFSFAAGSMGPKVEAACEFVEKTGGFAGIGRLADVQALLNGEAGTVISPDAAEIGWWENL